jgi:hypothetical protein
VGQPEDGGLHPGGRLDLSFPHIDGIMIENAYIYKCKAGHTRQTLDRVVVSNGRREDPNERI